MSRKKQSPISKLDFILENDFIPVNRITSQNYKLIKNMNAFLCRKLPPSVSTTIHRSQITSFSSQISLYIFNLALQKNMTSRTLARIPKSMCSFHRKCSHTPALPVSKNVDI